MKKCIKYSLIIIFIFLMINHINSSGVGNSTDENSENLMTQSSSIEIKDDDEKTESYNEVDLEQEETLSFPKKEGNISPNDLIEERCSQTEPLKGIIEDCIKGNDMQGSTKTCCYLELKYRYNSYYGCIPINKGNLEDIKDKIKELKKELNVDSAKIKCKSSFIQLQLLLIICLNLIF